MRHLLLFDGVARYGKDVTATEKDGASGAALEQLQESELALLERELYVTAAELNAIGGLNVVERGGVHAECVQLVVDFASGLLRWPDFRGRQQKGEPEENDPEPHIRV